MSTKKSAPAEPQALNLYKRRQSPISGYGIVQKRPFVGRFRSASNHPVNRPVSAVFLPKTYPEINVPFFNRCWNEYRDTTSNA